MPEVLRIPLPELLLYLWFGAPHFLCAILWMTGRLP